MSEAPQLKQLTFAEVDAKNIRAFLEFVRDKATFEIDLEESILLTKYIGFMQAHARKVSDHVMELVSVVEQPKPTKQPRPKAVKVE